MLSAAYIRGVIDAFVKAGEMSPAFAAGVTDVLTKEAGILWDSPGENFIDQIRDFKKKHPEAYDQETGKLKITPEQAYDMINSGRIWWEGLGRRSSDYWGNRLRKWTRWWPGGDAMTAADYDAELQDRRNRFMRDYIAQIRAENLGLPPGVEAALQDKFVGDAAKGYDAASRHIHPTELGEKYGKNKKEYANKFRTRAGTAAMRHGLYDPKYDIEAVTPAQPVRQIYDDPRAHMYGDDKRPLLFTRPARNVLGGR